MIGGEKEFGERNILDRRCYFTNAFAAFQTFFYIYSTHNREFEVVKSCVRVDLAIGRCGFKLLVPEF